MRMDFATPTGVWLIDDKNPDNDPEKSVDPKQSDQTRGKPIELPKGDS